VNLFSDIFYLGPTRVHPQRHYHWEGSHPEDLGRCGDKAIEALLSARVDKLTIQSEEKKVPIEERISEWLREMDLAHSFLLERTGPQGGKDYDVRLQKREHGTKVTLADMGYGLSQFLPVLVLCYYVPKGSTLILEQPGIHLHPKGQADLADLLIEVIIERNLQILVESHSEHLLTRLQLRIAEQKIPANETALYFCENENGASNIKPLEIDDLGNIKNWPKNFFGNVRGDLVKMTKEQMKRQKKAEG
jgi:predicted ATPase